MPVLQAKINQASRLITPANTKLESEVDWSIKFVILLSDPVHVFVMLVFRIHSDIQDDIKMGLTLA